MPHAESSIVPSGITNKTDFYIHVNEQLRYLLEGSTFWISNLSQLSSLLYHAYLSSPLFGINNSIQSNPSTPIVNWVGFYILHQSKLFVGPYHGKPACVEINLFGKSVCATAFRHGAVIVPNVDKWEGHIACDGETKSEIVIPLIITVKDGNSKSIGVLDLDSTLLNKFDEDDLNGLRGVVDTLVSMTDWQPFFSMV